LKPFLRRHRQDIDRAGSNGISLIRRSRFAIEYARRLDLAKRAAHKQQLHLRVSPGSFLAWAKRNDIEYPAELGTQVVARGHQIADWKSRYDELHAQFNDLKVQHEAYVAGVQALHDGNRNKIDALAAERESLRVRVAQLERALGQGQVNEKPLVTRVRDSLLKLIIGMAVKGYGYDPKAKRSDKITDIAGDLDSLGLSLDGDTIRKWLREAADLLPHENPENDCR
jgi:hypothetical protein